MKSRLGAPVEPEPIEVVSEAQRAGFAAAGFLAIERFLSPREVARARALVDELLARSEPIDDGMRFDYAAPDGAAEAPRVVQQLLPFDYEPRLFDTAFFRRSAALAAQLLGRRLRYRGSHHIDKPPRDDNPTPMHQDEAFWEPARRHEAIAVWLPFSAVDDRGSCMRFVPGSHRELALRPHRRIGGDPRVHGLELDPPLPPEAEVIDCPLPLGGVTVHHCRTIHGSGPNLGSAPRRALVVNLEAPPIPLPRPRAVPWQGASENALDARRAEREIELP